MNDSIQTIQIICMIGITGTGIIMFLRVITQGMINSFRDLRELIDRRTYDIDRSILTELDKMRYEIMWRIPREEIKIIEELTEEDEIKEDGIQKYKDVDFKLHLGGTINES